MKITVRIDREELGELVRVIWVACAKEEENPKSHHLTPWSELDERNQEIDRRIGEGLALYVLQNCIQIDGAMLSGQEKEGKIALNSRSTPIINYDITNFDINNSNTKQHNKS